MTPSTHGRLGYRDYVPWKYDNILPQVLTDNGYQTHCIGKTHFHPQRAHLGFEGLELYDCTEKLIPEYKNDYYDWVKRQSKGKFQGDEHGLSGGPFDTRPSQLPEELHNNSWVASRTIEFFKRRDPTRPFFLNLSFHRPHPPLDPPKVMYDLYANCSLPDIPHGDWAEKYNTGKLTRMHGQCGNMPAQTLDIIRRAYFAQIAHIDCQLNRVFFAAKQLKEPTAFVFTSDHGEMLGDHYLFAKTYAYEGSAKVPLIINMPGQKSTGFCDTPAVLEDIYPTILDIAGVESPAPVEGKSLVPCLNKPDSSLDREYIHGEHSTTYGDNYGMQFLTDGREKFIWFTKSGQEQFFNLQDDPQECKDLINKPEFSERVELWRQRLINHLADRPQDGLSDGKQLISGKNLSAVRDHLLQTS